MYTPKHFEEARLPVLHNMMRANSFATLVSADASGVPVASHLPVMLDDSRGEFGTLIAHVARANPQWQAFDGSREALVIFTGAHGYVSPSWYSTDRAVPTWNYLAVHAYGRPKLIEEGAAVLRMLGELVAKYESGREIPWRLDSAPAEYIAAMARAIVAFEIPIDRIEGKVKLSQNRPEDAGNVIAALMAQGDAGPVALAEAMRELR